MGNETPINEPVEVWAFFDSTTNSKISGQASSGQAGIFPIAISWRRRLIKLDKVIFSSSKQVGQIKLVSLVCASEDANFELEYNSNNYSWKLRKVMDTS